MLLLFYMNQSYYSYFINFKENNVLKNFKNIIHQRSYSNYYFFVSQHFTREYDIMLKIFSFSNLCLNYFIII